ncbi:MAG: hypothetical protein NTW94_05945 [Legionellales bacterium]|nr:hypothetical protein [Legionellales bacterium]
MKSHLVLGLLIFSSITNAEDAPTSNQTWTCVAHDVSNKQWVAKNTYQQIATTKALEACKQESRMPLSCKALKSSCDETGEIAAGNGRDNAHQGYWQCVALDYAAKPFNGHSSPSREDAASLATNDCHEHSALPETCYLNFLTCDKL